MLQNHTAVIAVHGHVYAASNPYARADTRMEKVARDHAVPYVSLVEAAQDETGIMREQMRVIPTRKVMPSSQR